jgi:hypothetical protein
MSVIKVRKWDYKNKRHVTDAAGSPVYVEIPTGERLSRLISEEFGGHTVRKSKADSNAGQAFLEKYGLRLYDVYAAYNKDWTDLDRVEMRALLSDTGLEPLFPTLVLEGVAEGFRGAAEVWQELIATTVTVNSGTVEDFQFVDDATTADDFTMRLVGEGGRIPTARITVSGKHIYIVDRARGLDWTDRAQRAPVSLADTWLRKLGRHMAKKYFKLLALRLKNGYFDDGSDAPFVLHTTTPGTWTLPDLLAAIDQLEEEHNFEATDLMASGANLIALSTLTIPGGGGWVFPNGIADKLGLQGVHRNNEMGPDEIALFDRNAALTRYELKPFGTETDRTPGQRLNTLYATISDEIVPGDPMARVLLSKAAP